MASGALLRASLRVPPSPWEGSQTHLTLWCTPAPERTSARTFRANRRAKDRQVQDGPDPEPGRADLLDEGAINSTLDDWGVMLTRQRRRSDTANAGKSTAKDGILAGNVVVTLRCYGAQRELRAR